jgi:PKD repeat protein
MGRSGTNVRRLLVLPCLLLALLCLAGAALSLTARTAAANASTPHAWPQVSPLRPANAPQGTASPFKLAHSVAHGLARHGGGRARVAGPLAASPFDASCTSSCATPLLYYGGPVMHNVKVYLIKWEPSEPGNNGQSGTSFTPLEADYLEEVEKYIKAVAAVSDTTGDEHLANVFSVDTLYGEESSPGEYHIEFGGAFVDKDLYPERNTTSCPFSTKAEPNLPGEKEPCISDSEETPQFSEEVAKFIEREKAAHGLHTELEGIYVMLTPESVNSCAGFEGALAACNTNFYCAYHSAFEYEGGNHIAVYANMPYDAVPGCEVPDQPQGARKDPPAEHDPADSDIDTLTHETNESITDPFGNAWLDIDGNEVADKCTYPYFDPLIDFAPEADDYGLLLGGTPAKFRKEAGEYILVKPGTGYNQLDDGEPYLAQRMWSNVAGGCVQRAPVPSASFAFYPTGGTADGVALASSPIAFNGAASSPTAGAITGYSWEFGDGQVAGGAQVEHTYERPGKYTVTLTVTNDSGATATTAQNVEVLEGSPGGQSTVTVTTPAPPAVTVTTPAPPPVTATTPTTPQPSTARPTTAYTAAQIAAKLGLPANGARLSGLGSIPLGHATCPPACGVTLRLTAAVASTSRGHTSIKQHALGTLHLALAANGKHTLTLSLNAAGRTLLGNGHTLKVTLTATVADQLGGSWQVVRTLTLTDPGHGHAARRAARPRG